MKDIDKQRALVSCEKRILTLEARLNCRRSAIEREVGLRNDIDEDLRLVVLETGSDKCPEVEELLNLRERRDKHTQLIDELQEEIDPLREELAKEQASLHLLQRAALIECISNEMAELPGLSEALSLIVAPLAKKFGEYHERIKVATSEALPIIARGDSQRIRSLENRVRTAVNRGLLAQILHDFRTEGIELFDATRLPPFTFDRSVRPVLHVVIDALQVDVIEPRYQLGGRALYKSLTNLNSLFGIHLKVGEVVSLPEGHPDVQKMISLRAIEKVEGGATKNVVEESV